MSTRRIVTALVLVSFVLGSSVSAEEFDGGYAAAFLQVPIGARPAGMGGAYRAVSNDAAGPLYNPAGLAKLNRNLFGTAYRAMRLDRVLGYAAATFPVRHQAVLGVNWLYAGSGSVAMRDFDGVRTGSDFSLNQHVFGLVFAKRFERLFAAGVKLNYFHARIPEVTAFSVGFDFGGMFYLNELINRERRDHFPIQDMQAALTIKNIAATYPWNSEKFERAFSTDPRSYEQDDKVPVEVGLGVSGRLFRKHLLLALDGVKNTKQNPALYAGAEYFVSPELALRAGYADGRLAFGSGYIFKISGHALAIDYAFNSDKADEGSEHLFSLDLLW